MNKPKIYDLLIVGNGFDLASGYETSYQSFLNYCRSEKRLNNYLINFFIDAYDKGYIYNAEWNGFENLLCQYLQFLDFLFKSNKVERGFYPDQFQQPSQNKNNVYYGFYIKDVSSLPDNIFLILHLQNPLQGLLFFAEDKDFKFPILGAGLFTGGQKSLYMRITIPFKLAICNKEEYAMNFLLEQLDNRLNELENILKDYIRKVTIVQKSRPKALTGYAATRIISFNYSGVAQKSFNVDKEHIAYVHGTINKEIVVGVEPLMIKGQTFDEESNYIRFFKRFRSILKNCNEEYNKNIQCYIKDTSIIAIYGHSLDLSDKSILKPILEGKYKRCDIYCYEPEENYKFKIAKLIGVDLFDEIHKSKRINFINIGKTT